MLEAGVQAFDAFDKSRFFEVRFDAVGKGQRVRHGKAERCAFSRITRLFGVGQIEARGDFIGLVRVYHLRDFGDVRNGLRLISVG